MLKIGIPCGHGENDGGASNSYVTEADYVREIAPMVKSYLDEYSIELVILDTSVNWFKECQRRYVDFSGFDYILELHLNSVGRAPAKDGRTTGAECFITSREESHTVEDAILKELQGLGFTNRGVKVTDFLVISQAKAQGVSSALLEIGFIDDMDDLEILLGRKRAVAHAIATGIIKGFGLALTGALTKTLDELANEVIAGKWGTGSERRDLLTQAGYDYSAVQARVNKILQGVEESKPTITPKLIDEVIAGKWGNGTDRRNRLTKAGYCPDTVQKLVNERYS